MSSLARSTLSSYMPLVKTADDEFAFLTYLHIMTLHLPSSLASKAPSFAQQRQQHCSSTHNPSRPYQVSLNRLSVLLEQQGKQ